LGKKWSFATKCNVIRTQLCKRFLPYCSYHLYLSLTVEAHKANSHSAIGWQTFTDAVIKILDADKKNIVFILWGSFAQKKGRNIDRKKHCVIEAAHPSPLSATKFFGCKVFSKANAYLAQHNEPLVDWTVPE
jgi:uracil-DNA glycosylase